ncbi:UbiA prenyltransferase family protein [Rhizomonospora bruguierae]|uniref:UbiA prenyltransferase family protein n=1 Tax=Rhizomonospora bruguierae TaxID=1581705 RepID=UPI001BCCBA17|nr:UbiA prenyltransferase family protein [Micromonospora sp. NBRC 107566]
MVAIARAERDTLRVPRDLLQVARPGQWPKNILVVPLAVLDVKVWYPSLLWHLSWAVAVFTVAAVLVYTVNDLADRRYDSANPHKWHRPIASGRISARMAAGFAAAQLVLLVGLLSLQPWAWAWPVVAYLLLNAAYTLGLKHAPLLDVFLVAAGFGLRLMLGYVVVGTAVASWLMTCVFSLCLLLTVGKRRHELATTGNVHRPALRGYTVPLIDQLMVLSAVIAAGTYLLYLRTEAPLGEYGTLAAALLAPLALFALFRYLQLVIVGGGGGDPVRILLRDPALVVNSVLWAGLTGAFLLVSRLPPG